jgi:cytoskeleton protein RodZ
MDHGVGQTLREARKRRRIDLAQVEEVTKIRGRFLLAIENEEWDTLPGEAYVSAFIRTYAAYLGLDGPRLAAQHRQEVGVGRPGERLLGSDPNQVVPRSTRPTRESRLAPRTLALLVSAGLVAVLVTVGIFGRGDEPSAPESESGAQRQTAHQQDSESPVSAPAAKAAPQRGSGLSLHLTATAEVWVCLLDDGGEPLVDGQILSAGSEAGPFRSGSFTVSLGNGEVAMTVNGQQASIPETPSPVGYSIGSGGELRELSEGERPTCT